MMYMFVNFHLQIGDFGLAVSAVSKTATRIKGTHTHIPPEGWQGAFKPDKMWDIFT